MLWWWSVKLARFEVRTWQCFQLPMLSWSKEIVGPHKGGRSLALASNLQAKVAPMQGKGIAIMASRVWWPNPHCHLSVLYVTWVSGWHVDYRMCHLYKAAPTDTHYGGTQKIPPRKLRLHLGMKCHQLHCLAIPQVTDIQKYPIVPYTPHALHHSKPSFPVVSSLTINHAPPG